MVNFRQSATWADLCFFRLQPRDQRTQSSAQKKSIRNGYTIYSNVGITIIYNKKPPMTGNGLYRWLIFVMPTLGSVSLLLTLWCKNPGSDAATNFMIFCVTPIFMSKFDVTFSYSTSICWFAANHHLFCCPK